MSDEIQKARAEVWEFAKTISGNLTADQYREIFHCGGDYEVFDKYTFEGAKELFAAWSQKNIEVGDICQTDTWAYPFVITYISGDKDADRRRYQGVFADGCVVIIDSDSDDGKTLRKTGRKIDPMLFAQIGAQINE